MSNNNSKALRLNQISKSFGRGAHAKNVLSQIDLTVPHGAFVALLGPSGCGKTTLLRIVAGLESPTGGEIVMGDAVLFRQGPQAINVPPERRGFGMVFQSYAVWPHMSVFDNVAYPLRVRGEGRDALAHKVNEALRLVHMTEYATRMPHQLSGGQQQRVALARGLVMQPPVLLLDEPLSNLDAHLRAELRREIRELHRGSDLTILYVTHDQREAYEMATHVVLLNHGAIEQQGTPEEVWSNPKPGFVAGFLKA